MKRIFALVLLFSSLGWSQRNITDGAGLYKTFLRDSSGTIVTVPAGKPFVFVSPSTGTAGYWKRGTAPGSGTVELVTATDTAKAAYVKATTGFLGGTFNGGAVTSTGTSAFQILNIGQGQNTILTPFAVKNFAGTNVATIDTSGNATLVSGSFGSGTASTGGQINLIENFKIYAYKASGAVSRHVIGENVITGAGVLDIGENTAGRWTSIKLHAGTVAGFTLTGANVTVVGTGDFDDLVGVTTNSNAAAGNVGEKLSSVTLTGAAVSLTTTATANIDSVSLTAGDWELSGQVAFNLSGATATDMKWGYSTTSATLGADTTYNELPASYAGVTSTLKNNIPQGRISVSGTTKVYLIAQATFTVGTVAGFGTIRARRMR